MSEQRPMTIMLVEDDPGHALLIEKNLRRAGVAAEIVKLPNGKEALEYLDRACEKDAHPPLLMLLDLNMPVLDGFGVIQAVKSHAATSTIPIVVVTTTDTSSEVERCYSLGCNIYITKPVDYDAFSDTMRKLGMFLSIVCFPGTGAARHG
jgi:CheY-like chemotaxis protein